MELKKIYRPIKNELACVEQILKDTLRASRHNSILEVNNYLLGAGGKRIRPALVILSARATLGHKPLTIKYQLAKIAAAMELIHMASLVHDDVIDHSKLRHSRPTINCKRGEDVAIALGDYLYSAAFELISTCSNTDILQCISSAAKAMCEGELLQVCERDNLKLLKERYLVIVKKKTAALFVASCHAGSLISNGRKSLQIALKKYGLNFGIAFQIIDDCLDLVGDEESLGKSIGQDINAGEFTLPILNFWNSVSAKEKKELEEMMSRREETGILQQIRLRVTASSAIEKTKKEATSFIDLAKKRIEAIPGSVYKDSLIKLADFVMDQGFNGAPR